MTRIDSLASNGPQINAIGRNTNLRRALIAVPAALALMVPSAAIGAEPTTGYNQTPPPPSTTTTTVTTPGTTVSTPARTVTTPAPKAKHNSAPATAIGTPVTIKPSAAPQATSLPFTGLDLRWVLVAGVLLLGMGVSVRLLARRQSGGWRNL